MKKDVIQQGPLKVFVVPPIYRLTLKRKYESFYGIKGSEIGRWIEKDPQMELCVVPEQSDALLFTGGPDIHPSLYNQPRHPRVNYLDTERDLFEKNMFHLGSDKFKIGICRGAQLLNVLSGGSMIQHLGSQEHLTPHSLFDVRSRRLFEGVPSTHHQMMVPSKRMEDREIIATAYDGTMDRESLGFSPLFKTLPPALKKQRESFFDAYHTEDFNLREQDPEIIYYRNTGSLCIQSHPERLRPGANLFSAYCAETIIEKYIEFTLTRQQQQTGEL